MKTLTITDAQKNLGRWLAAAARADDIGIVCGSDIVALRKVEVESTDYAQREYGALPEQVAALEKGTEQPYRRLKRGKKLRSTTAGELRKMLGKLLAFDPAVIRRLRELPKERKSRVPACSCDLLDGFGQPHVHSGLGIRKLGSKLFECRGNRDLRYIFQDRGAELFVSFRSNHDEIRALLRRGSYR